VWSWVIVVMSILEQAATDPAVAEVSEHGIRHLIAPEPGWRPAAPTTQEARVA
jgi:hypothetical protein